MEDIKLYNENCLETMGRMKDNSIDSIVTDPPYGLSFMGKKWDYDVPSVAIWKECLRVLKSGGYLLSFAGTRTQHRMAVNIEDAGFEIRDMIAWVYGSGFPKSHNIGKAVDKLQGNDRDVVGQDQTILTKQKKDFERGTRTIAQNFDDGAPERNNGFSTLSADITKGTTKYEGWGTALKPAWENVGIYQKPLGILGYCAIMSNIKPALEPITVARKPLSEKTVAKNVLKYGTGGINIDGCRVGMTQDDTNMLELKSSKNPTGKKAENVPFVEGVASKPHTQGRFPANFIHDGSEEVVGLFPDSNSTRKCNPNNPKRGKNHTATSYGQGNDKEIIDHRDSGSASRFFYCAKTSKRERNDGLDGFKTKQVFGDDGGTYRGLSDSKKPSQNSHPTVKPIALMSYLVRLVTPVGGWVYDPFMGSGSTGKACTAEGFKFIGSELEKDYCEIARARLGLKKERKPIDRLVVGEYY